MVDIDKGLFHGLGFCLISYHYGSDDGENFLDV